jgi:uncharacterized membrane protein
MGKRYSFLDALRGLTVISMVLYHFSFDVFILQGLNPRWLTIPWVHLWQQSICWSFLLLAGISFHLGRHHWRNGLLISACGIVVTVVTLIAEPEQAIWYGVLTCHGACLLLASALEPVLRKVPAFPGGLVSFLLFALTYDVQMGLIRLGSVVLYRLPGGLYETGWLAILGFPAPGFVSSDYFPLLPWFFLYLTGLFLGKILLKNPPELLYRKIPVLDWIGRHSLLIYMAHQPIAMAVSMIVAMAAAY